MIKHIPAAALHVSEPNPAWFGNGPNKPDKSWSNGNWLKSRFHFSFAEYRNNKNDHFGVLRVMNDDLVQPKRGFGTHPHEDMEIMTYVVHGKLTHKDSMGNSRQVGRGGVQYMSAGTGVRHSEHNTGKGPLRFIQCWVVPDRRGYEPRYGQFNGKASSRKDQWAHLVSALSDPDVETPVKVHQDVNMYATELNQGVGLPYELQPRRQAYILCIEGEVRVVVNGREALLQRHDALEVYGAKDSPVLVEVIAEGVERTETGERAHLLMFEMQRDGSGGRKDL